MGTREPVQDAASAGADRWAFRVRVNGGEPYLMLVGCQTGPDAGLYRIRLEDGRLDPVTYMGSNDDLGQSRVTVARIVVCGTAHGALDLRSTGGNKIARPWERIPLDHDWEGHMLEWQPESVNEAPSTAAA